MFAEAKPRSYEPNSPGCPILQGGESKRGEILRLHLISFYLLRCPTLQITANHALSDCHAMGGRPVTALCTATVPYSLEDKMEEELFQMMAGASEVRAGMVGDHAAVARLPNLVENSGCVLVGGHTCEGEEASLGECRG